MRPKITSTPAPRRLSVVLSARSPLDYRRMLDEPIVGRQITGALISDTLHNTVGHKLRGTVAATELRPSRGVAKTAIVPPTTSSSRCVHAHRCYLRARSSHSLHIMLFSFFLRVMAVVCSSDEVH